MVREGTSGSSKNFAFTLGQMGARESQNSEGIGFDSAEGMSPTLVVLQHQCVKGTGLMLATDRSRPEPPFSLSLCFL